MKRLYILIFLFILPVIAIAQPEKDALLKKDHDSIQEIAKLMYYLDQKAMHLMTMEVADKKRVDADFKAFYNDSIVAGNPTKLDVSEYIGYHKGKQPKNAEKFFGTVFKTNAGQLLELVNVYGYLSAARANFKVGGEYFFSPIAYTIHTSYFDKNFNTLFEDEFKSGNMPEKDYQAYLIFKNKNLSKKQMEKLLSDAGIERRN